MTGPRRWPALVLAAGFGTRLGPLGRLRAKAALPVAGRPLIVRILEGLGASGLTDVVINLHHQAESICAVVGDGRRWGLQVRYSWEPEVLGSGGGPARAVPLLAADRFFIVNGDTLADVDLQALAATHERSGAEATLAVAAADLTRYNALVSDAGHRLLGSAPRGSDAGGIAGHVWHFVGVQAVNASVFAGHPTGEPADIVRQTYAARVAARPGAVRVFPTSGAFHDIGTPGDYLATASRLAAAEQRPLDRGLGVRVAPTARVHGSILWNRVTVEDEAELIECIVTDDVTIPAGVRYHRHVITRESVVAF